MFDRLLFYWPAGALLASLFPSLKINRLLYLLQIHYAVRDAMITRSIRLEKEMWERIPQDNKSEFIRDVLQSYMSGELVRRPDIKVVEQENRLLHQQVEDLKRDKEHLWDEVEHYRGLYLPRREKDKKWWQFWK